MQTKFELELEVLINRYSVENDSDTADHILAKYLIDCLEAFQTDVRQRDKHEGESLKTQESPFMLTNTV